VRSVPPILNPDFEKNSAVAFSKEPFGIANFILSIKLLSPKFLERYLRGFCLDRTLGCGLRLIQNTILSFQ